MNASENTVVVDVREDLREGREPFQRIMMAANALEAGQDMELWALFEPKPLFAVLAGMGFDHETEAQPNGDWRVRFFRPASARV
jgi:uncharacterized protein (DUF2249 family)